jgi:hypothetical protein
MVTPGNYSGSGSEPTEQLDGIQTKVTELSHVLQNARARIGSQNPTDAQRAVDRIQPKRLIGMLNEMLDVVRKII